MMRTPQHLTPIYFESYAKPSTFKGLTEIVWQAMWENHPYGNYFLGKDQEFEVRMSRKISPPAIKPPSDFEIELLAGQGNLDRLKELLGVVYTQLEVDTALENAIAYSQIQTADYLLTPGAKFSNYDYQGVYHAVHNNEIEGLKYAVEKGVDINVNRGMLVNASIMTATNTQDISIVKWLFDNGADLKYLTTDSLDIVERYGTAELKDLIKNARYRVDGPASRN